MRHSRCVKPSKDGCRGRRTRTDYPKTPQAKETDMEMESLQDLMVHDLKDL
jgi:hypothetical protein